MTTVLALTLAAGIAAVALIVPSGAEAGYSSQLVAVSDPAVGGNTALSDIAMAPNGDALIAWSEGDATNVVSKVRRIHPDGSMGPILTVSDGTQRAFEPKVAFAPDGRALVAWVENISGTESSARARWIEPDDTLGLQLTIRNGGVNSDSGDMAISATSTSAVLVAWHNLDGSPGPFRKIEARRVNPNGTIGPLIEPISGAGSVGVEAAPDSSGGTVLAWREGPDGSARSIAANDALGTTQSLGAGAPNQPSLASDGGDHFQLLYRKGNGLPTSSLEYRALAADGTLGPEQNIDPAGPLFVGSYDVATNAANRSLAAWGRAVEPEQQAINARFIGSDGAPEATTLTTTVSTLLGSAVDGGIGGSGSGAIAWSQTSPEFVSSIWGRTFPAGGSPSTPVQLSSATGGSSFALVEMAANDVGVSAWRESLDPTSATSQAQIFVRQILPAPVCPDAAGTVVQGRPTRIDLSCTGLQLEAPQIVGEPAHGTLDPPDAGTQSVVYTPTPGFEGTDSFSFAGANRGGTGATQTATVTVGKDTVKPTIKKFKITRKRVDLTRAAARAKGKKPAFKLGYSEDATARIVIERRNECAKGSKSCKKFKRVGKLKARPAAISAKVILKKRLGGQPLEPGAYRASAVATDLAGNRSKPKRLKFKVVGS